MSRFVFAFLVIMVIFSTSFGQQCGLNEEFKSCGTACEPSCTKRSEICTMQCVIGCQCKSGYLRNDKGTCVVPENC
ncbi:hypothetical protein K0M31_009342 [Melipona bicolor]|uniref:TIL domain-containing protein n=1 Tax=Melipona bicolor TaxID=60889 RepID=A0AA40FPF5_9HYME|nr:hypothetical protein K0M31_009342 [Melipona bicolor]